MLITKYPSPKPESRARGSLALAVVASILPALPPAAHATQYSLDYKVDSRYRYNENVGMRPDNAVDIHGAQISLPAKLSLTDTNYNAYVDGTISSSKYDESGYNSDDQLLKLGGEYKLERGAVSGEANLDRNSTTDTEFLDTGDIGASASRVERYGGGANLLYYISEKNAIFTTLQYFETEYDSPRLIDNNYSLAALGLTRQYSERTTLQIQADASRFENDALVGVESDGLGLQVGFNMQFNESLAVSLLGGYRNVKTEYSTPSGFPPRDDDESSGWVVDSSVIYNTARSEVSARFVRRESASGDGYLLVSNQLRASYRYLLTERWSYLLETVGGTSGAIDEDINNDRDYVEGSASMTYQLTQNWRLTGKYSYRYQDKERATGDADASLVNISLVYKPNAISWSR